MTEYEELVSSVEALGLPPEQKLALLSKAKELNIELGKRGSDLITAKKENENLAKNNMSYKAFSDSMAKYNLTADDIDKIAKNAGIDKTNQDTIDGLTSIIAETKKNESKLAEENRAFKQEKFFGPKFDSAVKDFQHEGKAVSLLPAFIDGIKGELFKGIKEGDNDVIVQDRINKALLQAKDNQDKFLSANGLVSSGTPLHRVAEPSLGISGGITGIRAEELQKQLRDGGGTVEAATAILAKIRTSQIKQ